MNKYWLLNRITQRIGTTISPQWTPATEQLAKVLHGGGLHDQSLHLLLDGQVIGVVILGEIATGQFRLDAINHL